MRRDTETADRYLLVQNLAALQARAGVDPDTAELVVAYARLAADRGRPLDFGAGAGEPPWSFAVERLLAANPDLPPAAQRFLGAYARLLHGRRLPVIYDRRHLAARLDATPEQLDWMAWGRDRYRAFTIPKATGGERRIEEPVARLKRAQRWLLEHVLAKLPVHRAAHAFRPGRSILTNARKHLRRRVVVRLDLEDFFHSVDWRRVRRVFLAAGYPYSVANQLAGITTLDGGLPIGAPTSPALANQVLARLDARLWGLARERGFRYSRYADDLTFSSPDARFPSLLPFLKQVVVEEGFRVNERKVAIARQGGRQKVTGLVVNRRPNVPREEVRWLRAVLHNCRRHGAAAELPRWCAHRAAGGAEPPATVGRFGEQLAGRIGFIRHIHPALGERLWRAFKEIDFS